LSTAAAQNGKRLDASPALEAFGVSKRYGDREALCDVNLVATPGQLHGLLGPNGAGKTTLMRVLLGLVRRDAGTVRLLGSSVDSIAGGVPHGVAGFVDAPAFYPYLSARKNLALFSSLDGNGGSRRDIIDRTLEQVGLATQAGVAVRGYSAGMRQRLGLAAAMLRSPRLLFLDEPTSSLDPAGARDLRNLARSLADEGAAVVLSSHDMAEVEELCSALTVINHGQVVFSGPAEELRKHATATIHLLQTSNDRAALDIAFQRPGLKVSPAIDGGLEIAAEVDVLDGYVIALGHGGVAVRGLERRARSLESLFLELTGRGSGNDAVSAAAAYGSPDAAPSPVSS
jgi:ABC-2 type transport system ATP-binding protein